MNNNFQKQPTDTVWKDKHQVRTRLAVIALPNSNGNRAQRRAAAKKARKNGDKKTKVATERVRQRQRQ
jgi:hypothetical protein